MRHENSAKIRKLKLKSLGIATLLTFTVSLSTATAQENANAAGGDALGSGGTASYSVGQVLYTTNTGTNGSVAQGVQQPYEISVVTGLEEVKGINLSVEAYPNPTTDFLTLSIDDNVQIRHALSQLSFQLYDSNGKLLQHDKITGTHTGIVMSNLIPAAYFLKVTEGNKEVKTFKIIKD